MVFGLRHLCVFCSGNQRLHCFVVSLVLVMAVKIGSVLSVKMRRAQDRMAALDKIIQNYRASLGALERGSAVASIVLAMDGTGEGVGIGRKESCTGRKQNRTGRKRDRSGRKQIRIRTGQKQDRSGRIDTRRKRDRSGRIDTRRKQDRSGCKQIRIQTGRKQDAWIRKGVPMLEDTVVDGDDIVALPSEVWVTKKEPRN